MECAVFGPVLLRCLCCCLATCFHTCSQLIGPCVASQAIFGVADNEQLCSTICLHVCCALVLPHPTLQRGVQVDARVLDSLVAKYLPDISRHLKVSGLVERHVWLL